MDHLAARLGYSEDSKSNPHLDSDDERIFGIFAVPAEIRLMIYKEVVGTIIQAADITFIQLPHMPSSEQAALCGMLCTSFTLKITLTFESSLVPESRSYLAHMQSGSASGRTGKPSPTPQQQPSRQVLCLSRLSSS